jgi:hypothetical protein
MKTTTKKAGIKVTSGVKGGGLPITNHNQKCLKVRSAIRAGAIVHRNHNSRLLPA